MLPFWVVGADTLSSSYVACGDVLHGATAPDVLLVAPCADCVRGDRSSRETPGARPRGGGGVPGTTTEDRPLLDRIGRRPGGPCGGCRTEEGTVPAGTVPSTC